ncbi:hypothetical protein LIER_25479 [Lithospermum erythrorhizon]|uniref:Cupin type-1 domain-containing protein n=1 Tax=Lithospermum erythrorhizon TaxID=34254 RepID=A0AAV3R4X5_LITER
MAKTLALTLSLCFLLAFSGCFAQLEQHQTNLWRNLKRMQQHRVRAKTDCSFQRLNAQEPAYRFEAEAGVTEMWDDNSQEFQCAGVQAIRRTIEPQGLVLPYYTNTPKLIYVIQGRGVLGTVFPGCAETYETELRNPQELRGSDRRRGGEQSSVDRHQKVRRFSPGDVLAVPAGVTIWAYNDGKEPIVTISLADNGNDINQLDLNHRNFFLAGNPSSSRLSSGQGRRQEQHFQSRRQQQHGFRGQSGEHNNILNGFDEEILSEIYNLDTETIRNNIQGQNDDRGSIVFAPSLELMLPEYDEEEQYQRPGQRMQRRERSQSGRPNGLEETFCTMKLRQNIGHSIRADVYSPRGGRISTANSQTLPILSYLQLSAEKGVLYDNAIMAPYWVVNAHAMIYVTRGRARIQVVGNRGECVFDDEVREGQILVVPQNFVVIKKATNEGFEWVSFKTNDNAMNSQLAGRLSTLKSMPIEVLMNSYQMSREDASSLKYGRQEATLLSPSTTYSSRGRGQHVSTEVTPTEVTPTEVKPTEVVVPSEV